MSPIETLLAREKLKVPAVIPFVMGVVAIFISFFHLLTAWFGLLPPYPQRAISLSSIMVLGFFFYPLGKKSWKDPLNAFFLIDLCCISFCVVSAWYVTENWFNFIWERAGQPNNADMVIGTVYILLLLELGRRCLGIPIISVCVFFVSQNVFAPYFFGWLRGPSISWKTVVEVNFLADHGIFTIPMGVVASFIVVFLLFAAFLDKSGMGKLVNQLSLALTGRYVGGPAKTAIVASGIIGTTQGVAASNVVTTGSFTIPLMKSLGYKPDFAGAVETVASTGGQLAPPIMGVTAFLIAEFLGVPYLEVVLAAIIPTIIYYTTLFVTVHLEARRVGLQSLSPEKVPPLGSTLKESWMVGVPILLIMILVVVGLGLTTISCYAVFFVFLIAWFNRSTWWTPRKLLLGFEEAARMSIVVALACSVAGLIIGTFYVSGLGHAFATAIVSGSGGNLEIALVLTALFSLILGMAMPTAAVYITLMIIVIPALIEIGCNPFAAHFFVFYMGNMSCVTPPVAVPAYAAAAIAGSSPMRTAVIASKIAFPLYIVPFFFPYYPSMLWQGPLWKIGITLVTALLGAGSIACAFEGWFLSHLKWIERGIAFTGGMLLIIPNIYLSILGIALMGLVLFFQVMERKEERRGKK